MPYQLTDYPPIIAEIEKARQKLGQFQFQIKFLRITHPHSSSTYAVDTTPAADALEEWRLKREDEFRGMADALTLIARYGPAAGHPYVVPHRANSGIYEARNPDGAARLFFFLAQADQQLVVLTGSYMKDEGGSDDQTATFEQNVMLMNNYKASLGLPPGRRS